MDAPRGPTYFEQPPLPAGPRPRSASGFDERRELDHRVANSLQLAADFLAFEQARLADPQARAALAQASARMLAVGQLHRFLSGRGEEADVELESFLTGLCSLIVAGTGLSCSVEADPVRVKGEVAQHLAIAINELAMNAAKHAYRKGEPGGLRIDCRRDGGNLRLSVADDGAGLGPDFSAERATGLGMTILKAVVRQLRGSLDARNDAGARFTITVPLPAPAAPSRSFAPPG
ncbi:MAG TPA: sensor histidine kinase [Phenylobacterium sp.]